MQIYTLNIVFTFCQFDIGKNMFVDVSCIIRCDKSFIFNEFCKNKRKKSYFCKLHIVLQMFKNFLFFF